MRYTYDNSDEQRPQSASPAGSREVGPKSTDEMAELGLQVLPQSLADAATLVQSFVERDALANVALGGNARARAPGRRGVSRVPRRQPTSKSGAPRRRSRTCRRRSASTSVGRRARRSRHGADGRGPPAGSARPPAACGRAGAARRRDAVQSRQRSEAQPGDARRPRPRIGGRWRSIPISPTPTSTSASLLFSRGRTREALPHFERAVALRPNSAVIHTDYSSVLAASGRYPEALRHVRRALELNPSYGPALENLARLQRMGVK